MSDWCFGQKRDQCVKLKTNKKNQHEGKFNGTAEKVKKTEVKGVLPSLVDTCETLGEGEF